jgi:hypothetical protein
LQRLAHVVTQRNAIQNKSDEIITLDLDTIMKLTSNDTTTKTKTTKKIYKMDPLEEANNNVTFQDYVLALGFKESADDDTTFSQFVVSTLQSCLFCLLPKQRITPPPRRRRRRKKNEVTDDVILLNKRQTRNEPW